MIEEFKTAISQPARELKSKIEFPRLTLDDEVISRIDLDSSLVFNEDFEIGTAPMDTCKVEMIIDEGEWGRNLFSNDARFIYLTGSDRPTVREHTILPNDFGLYTIIDDQQAVSGYTTIPTSRIYIDPFQPGTLTISCDIRTNSEFTMSAQYRHTRHTNIVRSTVAQMPNTDEKWERISFTIEFPDDGLPRSIIYLFFGGGNLPIGSYIEYGNFKLEKGNIATPWTPAPEDILDYNYENKECNIELGLKLLDDTVEYSSIGKFTVEKAVRKNNKIILDCVDRMYKAEEEFENDLIFSTTILDILQSACEQSNITLATINFANADYVVPNEPIFEGITCRHIFAQVAELAGGYAKINRQGQLEIITLGNESVRNITKDHYIDFKRDDVAIGKVDKVIVKVGEEKAEQGEGDNIYTIVDNMFVQDPNDVVDPIYNVLRNVNYNACDFHWQGDFSLNLGDKITIDEYETYILDRKLKYTGGLREDYKAPAKSNVERNSTGKGNLILDMNRVKTQIKVIDGEITQTINEVRNIETSVSDFREDYEGNKIDTESKILNNTSVIQQLSTETTQKISQEEYDRDYNLIREDYTAVRQQIDNITNTIQIGGGNNLIKNSVGYGELNYWMKEFGEIEFGTSTWILEGVSKHGWIISDGMIYQDVDLVPNQEYTISGKLLKNTPAGDVVVHLYHIETYELVHEIIAKHTGETYDGQFSFQFNSWDSHRLRLSINVFDASEIEPIEVTDLMLIQGINYETWSQANGEVYTLNVKMDGQGIQVYNSDGRGKTIMSPEEFAGYYNDQKIFTLNGDITEVMGLMVKEKGLFIPPAKFVQTSDSLDIVWTGR